MAEIGDRIFYRHYDGSIGSAVITDIEEHHGVIYDDGKEVINGDYQLYRLGPWSVIESYNCLPTDDPDVVEYIQWHGGIHAMSLKEEIAKMLYKKGYISVADDISVKGFFINLYNIDEDDLK